MQVMQPAIAALHGPHSLVRPRNNARLRSSKGRVSIRGFSWYLNMSIIFWEQIATYRGHASPKTLNQLEL